MISREHYLERLKAFKDNKLIKVITGIRRCGKSTLLEIFKEYLLSDGVNASNIIHINLELMKYDDVRDYKAFYSLITEQITNKDRYYLLIDEIQQVEQVQIPNIEGLNINEAEKIIKELGLEISIENASEDLDKENIKVSGQIPVEGVSVNKGSKVYITY